MDLSIPRNLLLTFRNIFGSITLMLMIRLQRIGRKNSPHFRVVLTDKKNSAKSGKFLEVLGSYAARAGNFEVNAERVKYWIGQGAQTSDTMHNFLVEKKIITGKKINVLPKKHPIESALAETAGETAKEAPEETGTDSSKPALAEESTAI